jgi:outer membrane PBP1 activator LpoA protein
MMKERAELIMKSFNEPLTDVEQQRLNEIHAHLDRLEEPLWKARFDYLNSILEAAEQSAQRVKDISARIKAHENRDITPYDLLKEDIDAARPSRE